MNRIVREHYPVSKLPEDIRGQFKGEDEVTLIVEGASQKWPDRSGINQSPEIKSLEELYAIASEHFGSLDEVAAHVRLLRDEWK